MGIDPSFENILSLFFLILYAIYTVLMLPKSLEI